MIIWPIEILDNKYTRWYQQIVFRAQQRTLPKDHYVEVHHIIPRSLGGDNSKSNLARLTAREHFLCHWLLTKMLSAGKEKSKMFNALWMMQAKNIHHHEKKYSYKITSRVFESIRTKIAKITSERQKGKPILEETKRKIGAAARGRKLKPLTEERKKQLSEMFKGRPGIPKTEEQKRKHSELITGRIQSKEEREMRSKALKGKKKPPLSKEHIKKISEAKKGTVPWNKGKSMGEEFSKKMSEAGKGRIPWNKGITGYTSSKKGKKYPGSHSEEARLKKRGVKKDPAIFEHLRKPMITPMGIFPSKKDADICHGGDNGYRMKTKPKEYYYISQEEYIILTGKDI